MIKKPEKKEIPKPQMRFLPNGSKHLSSSDFNNAIGYNQCWNDWEAWLPSFNEINNILRAIPGSECWVGMIEDGRIAKAISKRIRDEK